MKNILITGGLGYIGSNLSTLYYKNEDYRVTVVDDNLDSKKIKKLEENNINFKNVDILDQKQLRPLVKSADVIYHLAGITSVPRIKDEETSEINKKIYEIGVVGTQNIIEYSDKLKRVIFPSTHVVFEGLESIKLNIEEDYQVSPQLIYSKTKVENEEDIAKSLSNFIILRLGSVHGFAGDSTRYNIMVNYFAQIASSGGEIDLHGGGNQLKSLVSINDVGRCFKFFEENEDFKSEIYHCVSENMTVKDVSNLCKKLSEDLVINYTDKKIPNLGYSLSNNKLLKTGFSFKYKVEDSLKDIIYS